jgi:DNA-binding GntR family transcriptional regulator
MMAQPRNRQPAPSAETTAATDSRTPNRIPTDAFSVERALADAIDVHPALSGQARQGAVYRSEHKTKTELALEAIRAAIMEGRMRPGARLTLTQLSNVLGMSITPIREAIRVLEADGLVSYEAHRGIWVTDLSSGQLKELTLLRSRLEGLATELAVPKLTQDDLDELDRLQRIMVEAAAARDDRALTQANLDWHSRIYQAADTQFVVRQIFKLWIPYGWANIWHDELRAAALRQHEEVHTAIAAGDAELAGQLMSKHILWVTDPDHWQGGRSTPTRSETT